MRVKETMISKITKSNPIDWEAVRTVRAYIRANWAQTFVSDTDDIEPGDIKLPEPYIVSCIPGKGHFRRMYYWDTFFGLTGAVLDGYRDIMLNSANNFFYLLEKFGYIPNIARRNCLRSQPPNASFLYKAVFDCTGDTTWLIRALKACISEHAFWMSMRKGPDDLNHYGHMEPPKGVADFYDTVHARCPQIPIDEGDARMSFLAHKLAEAESGWDFSPRFLDRAMDIYPVDLNALLFALEHHIAKFMTELGDAGAAEWRRKAETRRQLMQEFLWNDTTGFYHDYDYVNSEQTSFIAASSYFALWCGVPDAEQAAKMVEALPGLETKYGLDTMAPGVGTRLTGVNYQWDSPNCWAPLQYAAIAGLLRYGYKDDAKRLASKWVSTVTRNFIATGELWEKYNAHSGGVDVVDEYTMPPMLGWTAGVYNYALNVLNKFEEIKT